MRLTLNDIPSKILTCFRNRSYLKNTWQVVLSERNHSLRSCWYDMIWYDMIYDMIRYDI